MSLAPTQQIIKLGSFLSGMTTTASLLQLLLCLSFILRVLSLSNSCDFSATYKIGPRDHEMKGMFVFGSSLVDNGNNNFLQGSLSRADYPPYGIDFANGSSGRFTNGKNIIDLFCEKLSFASFIPPFSDPLTRGSKIVNGVDFASGGSGILNETGFAVRVTNLNQQISNFEDVTLPELESEIGCQRDELLKNYLFVLGTGGNDYSFNYFAGSQPTTITIYQFAATLTSSLSQQIKRLYNLGGKKFVIMSVNPIGCYPTTKMNRQPVGNGCVEYMNEAVNLFNSNLQNLVYVLKAELPGSQLVFVNSYKIMRDIITNPESNGFKERWDEPCCEVGVFGILCKRDGKVCQNRTEHVFFDGLHPTEAVNVKIANKAFDSGSQTEVYPINMGQLAKLKI